jgi:molybdopterin molybdotransferase
MAQEKVQTERQSVTVAEARQLILDSVRPLGDETVGLLDAAGRVLAEEIVSAISIPPADNSAMDGFALRAQDVARGPALLRVVDDLPAGRAPSRKLGPGEAARIMTGAAVPEGADAVVMIENTEAAGDGVRVLQAVAPGENIRRAGEDVRPGTPIAAPGERLRPPLIGMLAALGRSIVRVVQRPRVAVLSTGDELVEPDRLSADGRIVSSNSYNLQASLRELGCAITYLGIARDRPEEIEARFRQALACDAVISTGGVSVGDRDWIKQVLAGLGGRMRLWRVRMKPGAPLAFAQVEGRPVFGLPGNPVSTLVAFEQFVRPALLRMMGQSALYRPVIRAILAEDYKKTPGRLHFVRVRIEERDGQVLAWPTGDQGSHILLSMVRADGLAIAPEAAGNFEKGSEVAVQLLLRDDLRVDPGF